MPANHIIGDGQKSLMRTRSTFDSGLLAQSPHPFIATGGRVARFAGLTILESTSIDVVPPAKERTKQGNFGLWRRSAMNASVCLVQEKPPKQSV